MTEENNQQDVPNIPVDIEKIPESQEPQQEKPKKKNKKVVKVVVLSLVFLVMLAGVIFLVSEVSDEGWFSNKMVALYIAAGFIIVSIIAWFILRKTFRTRLTVEQIMLDDPDIDDWLVIFNWTPKALYFPTIIASFMAAILLQIPGINETAVGGLWFAVFFLNFIIEEYNISIKILVITIISLGFFLLWLHLLGMVISFLGLFKNIAISMNFTVYLLVGILGLVTIFISWLKGLFYYISLTPNYMNIQDGPTESGEQIGREDYNTRIDTSDFLERLMGFGRIIITFKDKNREPISVLVWRIRTKAEKLESVRGKIAIDHKTPPPNPLLP
jgi:hypothetical protein